MPAINIVDESGTLGTQIGPITNAIASFTQQVCTAWGLTGFSVTQGLARATADWNVCFVSKFPNLAMESTAYGYHETVNGIPIAYIRVDAYGKRSPFGTYVRGLSVLGKQITKPSYTPGIAAVAMHEIAEMLVDPQINKTAKDSLGRNWLMEICDHTVGNYLITTPLGTNVICPDFTHPSFYNLKGVAPYSHLSVPTAPFTLPKGAYGYYTGTNGSVIALAAGVADRA